MLSHILYGQSVLKHDGLLFKARAAGYRGQQVSLTVQNGDELDVAVTFNASNLFQALGTARLQQNLLLDKHRTAHACPECFWAEDGKSLVKPTPTSRH